jgi:Family of unknown function (DUF6263)
MIRYFSFILLVIFVSSCAQKDFATKYSFAEKTFAAKKYYYTLTNESKVTVDAPNKKNITTNKAVLGFVYEMKADSAGNRIVTITYDKFHIEAKKDDKDADVFDSEKEGESSPMMDRVLAAIKGSTIIIIADKKGTIISTEGGKEISDKITALLPNYEDGSNEQIKKQLDDFMGTKFVKDNIIQHLTLIPDSALSIGSTWTKKVDLAGDVPVDATVNYSLEAVENGIGTIHSFSDFKTNSDKPISIMGATASTDLKGKITADYKALEKSGFLVSADSDLNISGTISVSNHDVPVSIKITKMIRAKEVNR